MKDVYARFIFVFFDFLMIVISIYFSYTLYFTSSDLSTNSFENSLFNYLTLYPMYLIVLSIFGYEGIYTYRYDFWHESRMIIKSLIFGLIILFAYLAMTHTIEEYSRVAIVLSFLFMIFLIPISKNILKKNLYKIGLWRREATVYSNDPFVTKEIFENHYMGYIQSSEGKVNTVFINSSGEDAQSLHKIISQKIKETNEVIFVPLINEYDLTYSHIYQIFNTRTNLIVFQNRMKSFYRIWIKKIFDISIALLILPLLIPILLFIAFMIKKEEPKGSILFKHDRLGKNGEIFTCYKFRTMYENGKEKLDTYLKENPNEIENYNKYHKYINDPRITKIGYTLRKISLDELPQIFNVLKMEMSMIGPRPYMLNEKEKIGQEIDTILSAKPGITGLWQVSGRSDVDFHSRVQLDIWYINNWTLWMDLIILLKTIKVVLKRDGAY